MTMHNPSHPGQILRHRLIEDEAGQKLGSIALISWVVTAIP
ncbi:plasmid maintenance system antidote protein VapI [Litorivivens lipolytica]|uniref:Plasmid maintenance system antidote protein VapI n=1 Tax=Litorivivens lipolytica TaxID=1524264 RepID=A0A7W4Z659_9GAMM|nr:hypothetical protein [Litorivivens lipolytica]MBB3048184.1 plasmid maintenance system antidote protein VapI [Litorivivens lipolytica]